MPRLLARSCTPLRRVNTMPRQAIDKLKMPPKGYRPHHALPTPDGAIQFETREEKSQEDRTRVRLLKAAHQGAKLSARERDAVRKLINQFERASKRGKIPRTLASSVFLRKLRKKIVGWLNYLHDQELDRSEGMVTTFTVFPLNSWRVSSDKLQETKPHRLLEQFRRHLNKLGPMPSDGWLFVGLHCEFNRQTDTFDFHLHGVGAGSMIERIDQLRSTRTFGPVANGRVKSLIQIERRSLDHPIIAISYCVQSWWPCKSYIEKESGAVKRTDRRSRIPEPHHTQMLLWFDQHQLKDLTLMMGLQVRDGALIRTGKAYSNDRMIS